MTHTYEPGSTVYPHLHLIFPTGNNDTSVWRFEYNIGDGDTNFLTTYNSYITLTTVSFTNPNNPLREVILPFGATPMPDMGESSLMLWRVSRLDNAGGNTDPSTIVLVDFDIHYQLNKLGTPSQIPTPTP